MLRHPLLLICLRQVPIPGIQGLPRQHTQRRARPDLSLRVLQQAGQVVEGVGPDHAVTLRFKPAHRVLERTPRRCVRLAIERQVNDKARRLALPELDDDLAIARALAMACRQDTLKAQGRATAPPTHHTPPRSSALRRRAGVNYLSHTAHLTVTVTRPRLVIGEYAMVPGVHAEPFARGRELRATAKGDARRFSKIRNVSVPKRLNDESCLRKEFS